MHALGYPQPVSSAVLYPGPERERLLAFLLAQLLRPASLESVLAKLGAAAPSAAQQGARALDATEDDLLCESK